MSTPPGTCVFGPGPCHGCGQLRRAPTGDQFACWNEECPLFGVVSVEASGPQAADDHGALVSERDELWAAMQRVARNLCDCDATDGDECPVYPAEHREHCTYALAHSAEPESTAPIIWDEPNFSPAGGTAE